MVIFQDGHDDSRELGGIFLDQIGESWEWGAMAIDLGIDLVLLPIKAAR